MQNSFSEIYLERCKGRERENCVFKRKPASPEWK